MITITMVEKWLDRIIGHEGGFTDDPADRGNWTSGIIGKGKLKGTKYGISAMSYPEMDIQKLTKRDAAIIYKRDYLDRIGAQNFRPAIAFQLLDAAVNSGVRRALLLLQQAIGVSPDGIIGPVTRARLIAMDEADVIMRFLAERLDFIVQIKTYPIYGKGWTARIADNLRYAADDT